MDVMHLKSPLVVFGSEGYALTFYLSPRSIMLFHCSSTVAKDQSLIKFI